MFKFDVGVEIGTTNTKISFRNEKEDLILPSVVAVRKNTNRVVGIGEKAYDMLGKAPDSIVVKKTMTRGVVADFGLNRIMLREIFLKNIGRFFKKSKICVCFHSFMTSLEKLIFKNSIYDGELDNVCLIDESLASGIGAGLDFSNRASFFIVNIGGGTTDIAVIGSSGLIENKSFQIGVEIIDEIIYKNILKNYKLQIGKIAAEKLKKIAATFLTPSEDLKFKVKGKDLISKMPKTIELSQKQICKDITKPLEQITDNIFDLFRNLSTELALDVEKNGIILTGGAALIVGIKEFISKKLNVQVNLLQNPLNSASVGALNASNVLFKDILNL